jgi:rhodanese-related sulfurtransferase
MSIKAAFDKMVDHSKQRIDEIDVYSVKNKLDQRQAFHLIDVREPQEYQASRLPYARNIPRGVLELKMMTEMPSTDTPIVIYCGSGKRSALACDNLQKLGYQNVSSMAGGILAWQKAGFPIETEQ